MNTKNPSDLFDILALLRGADPRHLAHDVLKERVGAALAAYRLYPCLYTHRQLCYRARRCLSDRPWTNLHDCLNPPGGSPVAGRASLPRQEVIYTSWNLPTAIDEIGALPGELVQVVGMNIVPDEHALGWIVGDVERFNNSGRRLYEDPPGQPTLQQFATQDFDKYLTTVVIDSLLSELFSRASAKDHEHTVTALVAQVAYNSNMLLLYPSVRTKHALNISFTRALFDSKFQVIFTTVMRVEKYFTGGLYELETVAASSSFAADGQIHWSTSKDLPPPTLGKFGSQEPPATLRGWRPKRTATP